MVHNRHVSRLVSRKKGKGRREKISRPNGQVDEYAEFSSALKKILTVSHSEMKERIKRDASDRASNASHKT